MDWNDKIQSMSLKELSAFSLKLKRDLEDPNNFSLKDKLERVEIERKKKKLQELLIDHEHGGHKCGYLKKEIIALKTELAQIGINTVALEPNFTRQAIYAH